MNEALGSNRPARRRWARAVVGVSVGTVLASGAAAGILATPAGAAISPKTATSLSTATASTTSTLTSAVTAGLTQTNLLAGAAGAFGGTTGGWVGTGATLAAALTPSTLSTGSLQMTATATSWVYAESPRVAVTPGAMYTGEASLYNASAAPVGVGLAFYNSSGSRIGVVWGQTTTPASSTWATLPETAAFAPSAPATVALIVVAYNSVSVGQSLYVESPVIGAVSGSGSPAVDGPLHTSGNKIIQANGAPVTLQGVNIAGLEYHGTLSTSGITQQAVADARAWGANFVRLPLSEAFWLSSNCKYSSGYAAAVQTVVNWITSSGMVALLDLHTNTVGGCESPEQHNMADSAQSPTFWTQVSKTFGSNPLVAFDLYNEPHDISATVWLKGGQTTDTATGVTYNAAGMQQLYNAVRSTGAKNLVFVGGLNWAATAPSQLVTGNNIVYADHAYTGNPSTVVSGNLSLWTPLAATEPVVVTEFGNEFDPSNGAYNANVVAFAQAQGWGWSVWSFIGGGGGFDVLSFLSDGTADPNAVGVPVLLGLSGLD